MSLFFVGGSAHAFNRNDVFAELDQLSVSWNDISIKIWINDFRDDPDPGVLIGDRLTYNVEADKSAYFALILVDARGNTAVLKPDALATNGLDQASENLKFPAIEVNSTDQGIIEQSGPLGKETIYLIASDKNIPAKVFSLGASADYVYFGADIDKVRNLVSQLNSVSSSTRLTSVRYEYFVDSDTQFSTRGIRREVSSRVDELEDETKPVKEVQVAVKPIVDDEPVTRIKSSPLVINDITFEYDSDVLTDTGVNQLEILGSELIDRLEQNELPRVLLTGHTDSSGSAEYNMALSKRRSAASKRFLVDELGLPGDFIDTHGMGEAAPMVANDTDSGRARNRRVEFEIVR